MKYITIVTKILEGALEGDKNKSISYANLLADHLVRDGEKRQADKILNRLNGGYKSGPDKLYGLNTTITIMSSKPICKGRGFNCWQCSKSSSCDQYVEPDKEFIDKLKKSLAYDIKTSNTRGR